MIATTLPDATKVCLESSEITFKLLGLKYRFIFTPVYQPDRSSEHRGDLHFLMLMFCNVDWTGAAEEMYCNSRRYCREERGKEEREPESLVSAEFSEG